jgi:exosortase/archaeosortase family protein
VPRVFWYHRRAQVGRAIHKKRQSAKGAPPRSVQWRPTWRLPPRTPEVRFVTVFVVVAGALFAAYYFPYSQHGMSERFMNEWLRFYAHGVGGLLSLFDARVFAHGNVVDGPFPMTIVKSCDAMEANILFVAAVLALPGVWPRKAIALCAGLGVLVAMNLLRLCTLYCVGLLAQGAFDFAHYDLWPLLLIAFATVDFVICARWVAGGVNMAREPGGHARA